MNAHAEKHDGEIPDNLAELADQIDIDLADAIDGTLKDAKSMLMMADMMVEESKRLKQESDDLKNRAEKMISACVKAGAQKTKTPQYELKCTVSERVVIECDPESLPEEYIVSKTTITADKTLIKHAIKSGHEIAGCSIGKYDNWSLK
jgi:regulator of replication initiation timing